MGNLRHNPSAADETTLSSDHKHICRACRGAGKTIENQHGDNANVFGKENAQGVCPGCQGSGFHKPMNWHRMIDRS